MINLIGCLTVLVFSFLISNVNFIGIREAKILTIIGWFIALCFAKEGV
jgi:hypothetical protein